MDLGPHRKKVKKRNGWKMGRIVSILDLSLAFDLN
jgi:hypothetical protein